MKHALLFGPAGQKSTIPYGHWPFVRRLFCIMKLTGIILLIACFQVSASSVYSQKVTLKVKKSELESVFEEIRQQTGFNFLYQNEILSRASRVTLNISADLPVVLDALFKKQDLTYNIMDQTILVKSRLSDLSVFAEQAKKDVKGRVTEESGQALPGATINIKGTNTSTSTDVNGYFSLSGVDEDAILVFRYLGFVTREVAVSGVNNLTVVMKPDMENLTEVVVVGYGTQKKVNLTGSVSTVSSEDLAVRAVGQTSAALQGLAAGVTVTQRSGKPGSDAGNIRIRGIGTLGDSNPLVLVDGIEGSMDNLDPNLIESVSILKDAASSSIYGSRAANGVILVTTKRAKADKLSLNYDTYAGWQSATNLPKMANAIDHMLLTNEAYVNVGRAPLYSEDLINKYRTEGAAQRDLYPQTNWQDEVLTGSGLQQSHFLSLNGGTDKVKTLASIAYFDQKGIIQTSGFKRFSLRSNTDIKFSEKFNARFDLQFINARSVEPGRGSENVFHWMNRIPANQAGINTDGTWGEGWNGDNPIAFASEGGTNRDLERSGTLNFSVKYEPVKWLKAELTVAPVIGESIGKQFNRVVQTYKPDGTVSNYRSPIKSALTETSNRVFRNNLRGTLTFERNLAAHNFKLLTGVSREDFHNDYISAFRDGFILPDYTVLVAGEAINQKANGNSAEWALQSAFGRFNYNYKEKYLLEANARYDGSSRFSDGNKYGFFPSVSAGWRVSQEEFMKPLSNVISDLKLRASWGTLGNQNIGNYPFASAIEFGSSTLGNQIVNTAALNDAANPNISWETTEMTNIGIDVTLFSDLSITADYFDRETRDILYLLDIPRIIGLSAPSQNVGVVSNKGWELGVAYSGSVNNLRYNVNFNISDVKNEVLDLNGINRTGLTVSREGSPINSIYGLEAQGYFIDENDVASHAPQYGIVKPGDIKYKDQNNDGIINDLDNIIIGSTIPRFTYGSTLGASYKGFSFSALIQGVGKADGYLYRHGIMPFFEGGTVQEQHKDHWTPENPNAAFPRLAFSEVNNEKNSSFWMKDAAYLRLKNLQLGYTLPASIVGKMGMQTLRLFVSGQNLFTKDKFWNGYDVESPVGIGNAYPQVKLYSFGLNANF